ncbi:peptide-methionine (S)-S-oxide reductase MsrA [Spirosoma montaniterrae]|uniref:Peptide methionine sulfoxide reductase MsrA n=1 Tax=Spirosoma montaniterrae TaxID=1178516 RepID=A0A1P9WVW0_9BACT|nr:peptide-methionine (S)-S-oxide reductase MsrA [Spirosoma montaniterrae]AQG79525.1 protein-methionine-S-oxide reductase [Spirosoma montaniterrae]
MKALTSLLLVFVLVAGCRQQTSQATTEKDTRPAKLPALQPGEAVATFAAGCFWCIEEEFELLRGVREVVSGYSGGDLENPTYEQVGTDQTGHAEAVQIYYDPKIIPFDTLLTAFFAGHDATSLNRQGPDIGTQYRSIAFYRTPAEKEAINAAIKRETASGRHQRPIVTEVVPFKAFYPAEVYHQGYYRLHPNELYVQTVSKPKVEHFKERMSAWLKE